MSFAERNGFVEPKSIQIDSIDDSLRNRLYNFMDEALSNEYTSTEILKYIVDKLGYVSANYSINEQIVTGRFLNRMQDCKWYDPYTIIELYLEQRAKSFGCKDCNSHCNSHNEYCPGYELMKYFPVGINRILEEEKSGYRMIENIFVPITEDVEISEIEDSISTSFSAAGRHIRKSLDLYSSREKPDYENSIKESISAVESICCYITGLSGAGATLGAAIKKLESSGIFIHGAMKEAFNKLYGYASDTDSIRHGGIDFKNAPAEDAKYMLVSCSAFVNYLKEKYVKTGGKI